MPTIVKRAGGYQAKVRLTGHAPQSQVFDTKAKAAAWGHAVEAKLREEKSGTVKATLQEAIDKYITDVCPSHKGGYNEEKRLKALAKVPGLLPTLKQVREVTSQDLSQFRDKRLEEVSVATVRKEMTIIRSVLESARRDWGMLTVNPISDVKRPPAPPNRKRLMSDEERDKLLVELGYEGEVKNLTHQVAVSMLLGLETAMRAGEMLGLEWRRVHLAKRYVTLPKTKNGDQRDVPLSKKAVSLLESMQGIDEGNVFTLTSPSLDALFRKAKGKAKIEDLHFHDTRANAITSMAAKLDIHDLARAIGHRDLNSLLIYYRKSASDIASRLG
jgi:integrase